jgi:ribosomal protein L31E
MASRIITINMRKYLSTQPRTRRIKRSMRYLRERIAHYT